MQTKEISPGMYYEYEDERDIKSGVAKIVGVVYPTAKPMYREKYKDKDGNETGIEVVMGEVNGKGVIMQIETSSITKPDELKEMMINSIQSSEQGSCTYCNRATEVIHKAKDNREQVESKDIVDNFKETDPEFSDKLKSIREAMGKKEVKKDERKTLFDEVGIIPIENGLFSPRELFEVFFD